MFCCLPVSVVACVVFAMREKLLMLARVLRKPHNESTIATLACTLSSFHGEVCVDLSCGSLTKQSTAHVPGFESVRCVAPDCAGPWVFSSVHCGSLRGQNSGRRWGLNGHVLLFPLWQIEFLETFQRALYHFGEQKRITSRITSRTPRTGSAARRLNDGSKKSI